MAAKVVSMQVKLAAALSRMIAGEAVSVTAVAAELGVSRQSVYKYRRRFAAEGIGGLTPRSRRPHRCPRQVSAATEEAIVAARKALTKDGWDAGAISIATQIRDAGGQPPSVATINRVLRRRGLARVQPAKRPRSADRRFEYPASNDCWQIDAFECGPLGDGTKAVVFELVDDHSRAAVDLLAAPAETAQGAWTCLLRAIERYGLPTRLLSDNGTALSGARRGWVSSFEQGLRALAITPITSRPYHPQTCGKTERIHQTTQRWLAAQPPAADRVALQAQLDAYRPQYNQRRHQGIGLQRPAERWSRDQRPGPEPAADPPAPDRDGPQPPSSPCGLTAARTGASCPAGPPQRPLPTRVATRTVGVGGRVGVGRYEVCVGTTWAGAEVTTIRSGDHVAIFHKTQLVRELTLDPTRRYQPSGEKCGAPRRPRKVSTMS
jgi:transposase InsO family protein